MPDGGWVATHEDVTERKAAERALAEQNRRFDAALNTMAQGLGMFDAEGRIIVCNRRYAELYKLPPELTLPGTSILTVLEHRLAVGTGPRELEPYRDQQLTSAFQGRASHYRLELQDGRTMQISHEPMVDGGWVATIEDITETIRAEARIEHMARHDALTGLANRVLFREEMEKALVRVARGETVAVLCLDLDHFKSVNDTLGHPVGDGLLKAVTERLLACVRDTDTVARLGGDEFAILQAGLDKPESAAILAQRLIDDVCEPYDIDGHEVVVGASVGIAIAPSDGDHPDQLLKNADMALYRAKSDGRRLYRVFEREMDARLQARRALELDLRKALADGQFELFYQPLIDLRTETHQRLRGALALEPSRAGPRVAGRVHPARRGDRAHRAARRMGAARSLPRGGEMAAAHEGRGQPVAGAVQAPQPRPGGGARALPPRRSPRTGSSSRSPSRSSSSRTTRR